MCLHVSWLSPHVGVLWWIFSWCLGFGRWHRVSSSPPGPTDFCPSLWQIILNSSGRLSETRKRKNTHDTEVGGLRSLLISSQKKQCCFSVITGNQSRLTPSPLLTCSFYPKAASSTVSFWQFAFRRKKWENSKVNGGETSWKRSWKGSKIMGLYFRLFMSTVSSSGDVRIVIRPSNCLSTQWN